MQRDIIKARRKRKGNCIGHTLRNNFVYGRQKVKEDKEEIDIR